MMPRPSAIPLLVVIPTLLLGTALTMPGSPDPGIKPPAASFAILARDEITGEYGVAAASNAPLIGMNLEFLDYKVGGVVVLGGPFLEVNDKVMIGMSDGLAPGRAITVGLFGDEDPESRQVLALSQNGGAAFTGEKLPDHAGDVVGNTYVIAGNRLVSPDVLTAMEEAFTAEDGRLADRLLAALLAGRDAGGEEDGAHSAALLVVGPGARFATRDRLVELRIDYVAGDAIEALAEMSAEIDSIYGIVR
jgi:uncharacterized Ntn-hydrolase superfamily protein